MWKMQLAVLALGLSPLAVHATQLTPGGSVTGSPLSYGGTVLGSVSGSITPAMGTFTGNYTEMVYSDPNNVFGSGDLDFVYQFTNVGGSDSIEHLTGNSFDGYLTNVGYTAVTGGIAPDTITRTVNGSSNNGYTVDFNFLGNSNVPPGGMSDYLVVQTNATRFNVGIVSLQDGSAGTSNGLEPVADPVPEPATFLLLGTGLVGIAGALKRRISL